jgi:hypothetical protein
VLVFYTNAEIHTASTLTQVDDICSRSKGRRCALKVLFDIFAELCGIGYIMVVAEPFAGIIQFQNISITVNLSKEFWILKPQMLRAKSTLLFPVYKK